MIYSEIKKLVIYSIREKLIDESEYYYSINQLLYLLKLDQFVDDNKQHDKIDFYQTINNILDYAIKNNLIVNDTVANRDYFESKVINCVCKRPKKIQEEFNNIYKKSPIRATTWFYNYCKKTNYIKEERIKKDIRYSIKSKYGNLQITINLSKPEKDPLDIAKAKSKKEKEYPECQLCITNQGYPGSVSYSSRDTLRLIPIQLNKQEYFFQYSPYSYFNEHGIVLNKDHIPMKIDKDCFIKLVEFVDKFPHYMIGSNADLPIVGGSILNHDHYQCGKYIFPMFKAKDLFSFKLDKFNLISASFLNWPLSTIRLKSKNKKEIIEASDLIFSNWKKYTDKRLSIIAVDDKGIHNTITPILHKENNLYVMDLVLRNNLTNDQYPLGIFHSHKEYWNIKKENIGLIEVMGLAILPSRLKEELAIIQSDLLNKGEIVDQRVLHHKKWVESFINLYQIDKNNIENILKNEVGKTFVSILECCGIFKINNDTKYEVLKFISQINK